MNKIAGITVAAVVVVGIAGGIMAVGNVDGSEPISESREIAQAPAVTPGTAPEAAAENAVPDNIDEAPELTRVSAHLVKADGSSPSSGVVYFVFQSRLNEIPHANSLEKVKSMAEEAVAIDAGGSFTLSMKPGNFAMVYDPTSTEAPSGPGPDSMSVMKRLTKEQVQGRIAAIKENAAKGLPIENGKLGEGFVVENCYIRPPISDLGEVQLQSDGVVTIRALDDKGELINFPATLRLRGKNGDILEPHTPSISKRAQYTFHDILPQSYQVFALGSLPRPGGGDEITTPTVTDDQFIYTGDSLSQDVIVEQTKE